MNFIDAYDVTGPSVTPTREGPEPTLNEEVTQVVGQLSRFWGGFRKQSQSVFETARKDLTQVVSQAQKELTKLTAEPAAGSSDTSTTSGADDTTAPHADNTTGSDPITSSDLPSPSEEDSRSTAARPAHTRGVSVSATAQNIFSRLQSSLPADLASTVQAKLPDAIKQGAGSIDFTQLRTTLATEFQRVQDITRTQAEEYAHKSEELLRDAGDFFKEAVKVMPPEGGNEATPGVLWDGSDVWMLPEMGIMPSAGDSKGKEKEKGGTEGLRAVATRAEALLKQLRHDPEVVKADPEVDERSAKIWREWCDKEIGENEGGISGAKWEAAIKAALGDPVDGAALQKTMDAVVPSTLTQETFWTRYFFRVHQVESEEQRRKDLLQGTAESEEDFDWESDDDESADKAVTPQARAASLAESTKTISVPKSDTLLPTSGTNSRVSSEDGSYDVVSSQVSSIGGDTKPEQQAESDEEDDEDDDDDDDDDDEESDEDDEDDEDEEDKAAKKPVDNPKATKGPTKAAEEDEDDSDWE